MRGEDVSASSKYQIAVAAAFGAVAIGSLMYCSPVRSFVNDDAGTVVCKEGGEGCPCDPAVFKPVDCYEGPRGTNGKGICKTGKRTCTADGTLTACVGEVLP